MANHESARTTGLYDRRNHQVSLDDVAGKVCEELLTGANQTQIEALKLHFSTSNSVPPDFDRRLIAKTADKVGGRKLSGDETRHIRGMFVKTVTAVKA